VHEGAEGLQMGHRGGGLVIVHAVALRITLCHVMDLVTDDVTTVVSFASAYEFALQRSPTMWDIRAGDEDEHV
jgi:hypothetical protein